MGDNLDLITRKPTRKEAITEGLKVYWPKNPCNHGHYSFRYTSNGRCVACSEEVAMKSKRNYNW